MTKLNFKDKLKKKIDENNKKKLDIEKNKDRYTKCLKDKIIKDIEELLLKKVPQYIEGGELTLEGPIYWVKKNGNKLYIDFNYDDPDVFFDNYDDVKEFLNEIIKEFGEELKYSFDICGMEDWVYEATVHFKYEYKKN